jgi:hypothetical protein
MDTFFDDAKPFSGAYFQIDTIGIAAAGKSTITAITPNPGFTFYKITRLSVAMVYTDSVTGFQLGLPEIYWYGQLYAGVNALDNNFALNKFNFGVGPIGSENKYALITSQMPVIYPDYAANTSGQLKIQIESRVKTSPVNIINISCYTQIQGFYK